MRLSEVRGLAQQLMRQHGLLESRLERNRFGGTTLAPAWSFGFDNSKLRFGACHYRTRTITVSKHLAELNAEAEVRDTLLHEIAHALTPGARHGWEWKRKAAEIGARPERCYSSKNVVTPEAPFKAACARCEKVFSRYSAPRRSLYCRCWRAARVAVSSWVPLAWFRGQLVRPNPRPLVALPVAALSSTPERVDWRQVVVPVVPPPSVVPPPAPPRKPSPVSPRSVAPELEAKVVELRKQGLSHRKIEAALGVEGQNGFWAMKVLRKAGLR